ncbi:MAG: hypothetical protein R2856_03220 [Caldilineaceae bacterium]
MSQIVDLNDPALMPDGWATLEKPALNAFEDIVLYELHIRDFSAYDERPRRGAAPILPSPKRTATASPTCAPWPTPV